MRFREVPLQTEVPTKGFIIRATEVSNFLLCPRHWLAHSHSGLNLEPVSRSPKLRFGTCWHKGLEWYYTPGNDQTVETFRRGFRAAMEKEEAFLVDVLGDGFYDPEFQSQIEEEFKLAEALIDGYVPWSQEEAVPCDKDFRVIATERRLVVPLSTLSGRRAPGAYLAVKLDGVVVYNNAVYVLEHKSMAKTTPVDNPHNLPLDLQMGLQILALRKVPGMRDVPVHGAIYNLTRKIIPSGRVKAPIYARHVVRRSDTELANLERFLYKTYLEMKHTATKDTLATARYNPQMIGRCAWSDGCRLRPVCEGLNRGENTDYLLATLFRPRAKDIYETLEEEMAEN